MSADQVNLFDDREERTIIDQLLAQSRTYSEGRSLRELLDFATRMPQFAPFNAMLLHIQRPGLTFATSGHEWLIKFGRYPKADARPLLILWPFAPVAFVYDILDTEGHDLPDSIYTFYARGSIDLNGISKVVKVLESKRVIVAAMEAGDGLAGSIQKIEIAGKKFEYQLRLNAKHPYPTQFVTLAHELGHLFLGHLGEDRSRNIQARWLPKKIQEIEAELVAYLVARRAGIESASQSYLSSYLDDVRYIEIYQILRAAGRVEAALGTTQKIGFGTKQVGAC